MTFAAVVVVYNMFCGDSPTCQALEKLADPNVSVLIYDNSTSDYGNREACARLGWKFLGGTGNVGLSKAYNACVAYLQEQGFDGFVCLFDDDTAVTPAYFTTLEQAVKTGGQIFVPLIYADGRLLSPCKLTASYKTVLFENEEAALSYTGSDMTAINSAMAMDIALFRDYRYDENIFLDGIDHTHVQRMGERGIQIHPMAVRFDHQFSGDERPSRQAAATRFRIFAKDYAYIFRNKKRSYWYLVGKRALVLTVRYKSFVFLKILLKMQHCK